MDVNNGKALHIKLESTKQILENHRKRRQQGDMEELVYMKRYLPPDKWAEYQAKITEMEKDISSRSPPQTIGSYIYEVNPEAYNEIWLIGQKANAAYKRMRELRENWEKEQLEKKKKEQLEKEN